MNMTFDFLIALYPWIATLGVGLLLYIAISEWRRVRFSTALPTIRNCAIAIILMAVVMPWLLGWLSLILAVKDTGDVEHFVNQIGPVGTLLSKIWVPLFVFTVILCLWSFVTSKHKTD